MVEGVDAEFERLLDPAHARRYVESPLVQAPQAGGDVAQVHAALWRGTPATRP